MLYSTGHGINVVRNAALPISSDSVGTIGFFIKCDPEYIDGSIMCTASDNTHTNVLEIQIVDSGKLWCFTRNSSGANEGSYKTDNVVIPKDNTWHFVVLTCDGTNKYWYVDGVEVAATFTNETGSAVEGTWFSGINSLNGVNARWTIGYRDASVEANQARMSGAYLYSMFQHSSVFTPTQIATLSNSWSANANPIDQTDIAWDDWITNLNPSHRWKFDEGTVAGIVDSGQLNAFDALDYTAVGAGTPVASATGGPLGGSQTSGYVEFPADSTNWIKLGSHSRTNITSSTIGSMLTWMKNNDSPDNDLYLAGVYLSDNTAANTLRALGVWSSSEIQWFNRSSSSTENKTLTTNDSPLSTTGWNLIGVTCDPTHDSLVKLYANGAESTTTETGTTGSNNEWIGHLASTTINVALNCRNREGGGAAADIGEGYLGETALFEFKLTASIQASIYGSAQVGV
jgi:hypothetical protein